MPPPRFITCTICGKGFGSASIGIHIPQCYEKAMKRWQLNPVGPKPVMPSSPVSRGKTGSRLDGIPCGGGSPATRSTRAEEFPSENLNLHPCSICGRKFNFDRITYHESVCKGNCRRPVFDSAQQRAAEGEEGFGGVPLIPIRGKKGGRTGGQKGGYVSRTSSYNAPPQSTWRQQHEEFQAAMRAARQAGNTAKDMWRADSASSPGRGRSNYGGGGGGKNFSRCSPRPRQTMPPVDMSKSRGRGRGNSRTVSSPGRGGGFGTPSNRGNTTREPMFPPPRRGPSGFGGSNSRFDPIVGGGRSGGGGGGGVGGGGGKILNDNTSSLGMLQAFGRA